MLRTLCAIYSFLTAYIPTRYTQSTASVSDEQSFLECKFDVLLDMSKHHNFRPVRIMAIRPMQIPPTLYTKKT
jgi:hypothetical protein